MQQLGLGDSALFFGLDPAARSDIEQHMAARHLRAGEVLCRAGDEGTSLFVIKAGFLHAVAAGSGEILGRQRPGDVVGEAALLTGTPRSATLVARLPSEVLELSRDAFLAAAGRYPPLLMNLAGIVSQRMVARSSGIGQPQRSEGVAVVVGPSGWHDRKALAVAGASSSAAVTVMDLTGPDAPATGDVLTTLDASRRQDTRVFVVVGSDHDDLLVLLDYCDRAVALMSEEEARRLAGARQLPPERLATFTPQSREAGWLGRHLARTKLGVALGAGGAKGFAHVGVIRVLERAGYVIDYVAGSSMGAWVGAWLALGMNSDNIERTLRSGFTDDAARMLFRVGAAGNPSGTAVMEQLASQTTGGVDFGRLAVPLVIMTADLEDRRPVPVTTGPVHEAMVAAMTVPGLYPPVRRGRQRLVDAVVLTPVPTDAVIGAGADVTVAVNLLGREMLRSWPGGDPPPARPRRDRDTVVESLELAQVDASARQTALADVPVTPRFGPGTWRDFQLADRYIAAGIEAMEAALPDLRALTRPVRLS